MAYKKKVWRFENAVEVMEYHTGRYGAPGQKRRARARPTPEETARYNQKKKEDHCRHKLRANFRENDLYVTLTYAKELRPPDMEKAKKDFGKFIGKVSKEYRAMGIRLKWIRNIEVGTKGAWHIHLVINRIPDADVILRRHWTHGRVWYELLYEKGNFRDLAAYMTKGPRTDPRLREANYSTSRNLPVPDPEEKLIVRWDTWKTEPTIRKDQAKEWYLDRESFFQGVTRDGFIYRQYTMLRYRRE